MKITKDLRSLPAQELRKKLGESKKELLKFNVQSAMGTNAAQSGKVRQTKKSIARMLTLLQEKEVQLK